METLPSSKRNRFELLTERHDISSFRCSNTAIDDYLRQDAINDLQANLTKTYVLVDYQVSPAEVVGYFTLCADSEWVPNPDGSGTVLYPLIQLCWLARHQKHRGEELGDVLLIEAFRITQEVSKLVAIAGMHIRESTSDGKKLYNEYGFQSHPCYWVEKGLYLPINEIHAILATLNKKEAR